MNTIKFRIKPGVRSRFFDLSFRLLYLFTACLVTQPAWATTIDTVPFWNGTSTWGVRLGDGSNNDIWDTVGQTFVPPDEALHLASFAMYLSDSPVFEPDPVTFSAYLMEWDGYRPVGPVLFQSTVTTTSGLAHGEYKEFSFDVGLTLAQDNSYIFLFSSADYYNGSTSAAGVGLVSTNAYLDGEIVAADSNGNFSALSTTTPWSIVSGWDSAFTAEFVSTVPLPPGLLLLCSGLIGLIGIAKGQKTGARTTTVPQTSFLSGKGLG